MSPLLTLVVALFLSVECRVINTIAKWRPKILIVHGIPAHDGEYPYIVSIQENGLHLCGGNIINKNTIVTAAHCTIGRNTILWEAIAGTTDIYKIEPHMQKSKITNVIVHPKFERHSSLFDIAIAKVFTEFVVTPFVNFISLPTSSVGPRSAVIVGWGATTESGSTSNILLKTSIAVETKEQCMDEFGEEIEFGLLCAKTNKGDACRGDSGGPLVCNANELCGIISSGQGCGRENGSALYTEVNYFVDWIEGLLEEVNISTSEQNDLYSIPDIE